MVTGNASDSIQFLYNRGEGQVHFLTELKSFLDPARIAKLPGYKSRQKTRITLMTYELRSRDIKDLIAANLAAGSEVRAIVDASPIAQLKPLTDAEVAKLTPNQRLYYRDAYDRNNDGKITSEDIDVVNEERYLSAQIWKQLQALKPKYKDRLELVTPPFELVPEFDHFAYPHLTHFKWYAVEFQNAKGEWVPAEALVGSANLTDSCLDKRISGSKVNKERYLNGEAYTYTKGSEGNIQFASRISNPEVLQATKGPLEEWIALYKEGKNFDLAKPISKLWPRVVFQGKDGSVNGVLQAYFSEGTKVEGRSAIDPTSAIMKILSAAKEVKVIYDSQFVFTHKAYARHLRHHLARGGLEDLFIMVDGTFVAEDFSAVSDLLFAPRISNSPGVLPTKAISDYHPLPDGLDWTQKVFGFDGFAGVFGSKDPDKLHTKLSYYEYLDDKNVRHYLVAWGSANKSTNASRLNADGLYILDTIDAEMAKPVKAFFEGLKNEERKRSFSELYLEHRFLEMVNPDTNVFNKDYLKDFSDYLSKPSKKSLSKLIDPLEKAGAKTIYGENAIRVLRWYDEYSEKKLDWSELSLVLFVAHPKNVLQIGLSEALQRRWLGAKASPAAKQTFAKLVKSLKSSVKDDLPPPKTVQEIIKHCTPFLKRMGVPVPVPSSKEGDGK